MLGKVALWAAIIGALLFAIQGGEYSTLDLLKQRSFKQRLVIETDSLARQVDSLKREAELIRTDRATQERIAREQFGMVRGEKEVLYRLDSVHSGR